jgi:hypothetical protein
MEVSAAGEREAEGSEEPRLLPAQLIDKYAMHLKFISSEILTWDFSTLAVTINSD